MLRLSTEEEEWAQARIRYIDCLAAEVATEKVDVREFVNGYVEFAKSKTFRTNVGAYEVTLLTCDKTRPNHLPFAKGQSGFETHIRFRKTGSVSRDPYLGRLAIRVNGKQRIVEPMKDGTWKDFPEKIDDMEVVGVTYSMVFPIPDNTVGEVYWLPNKNSEKGALWCAHLDGTTWPTHFGWE